MTDVSQIADNNLKYGQWWCENLDSKIETTIKGVKDNNVTLRKLVRVKLYNTITLKMEELYLADLLNAMIKYMEEPFPSKQKDDKNQINIWGPYYISYVIYERIQKGYLAN